MAGRGPSYTDEEMKELKRIGAMKISLSEKADAFIEQFGDARSHTALVQKFRKLDEVKATTKAAKAPAEKHVNGNGNGNGNGRSRGVARFEIDGVVISGPAKEVARFVAQL